MTWAPKLRVGNVLTREVKEEISLSDMGFSLQLNGAGELTGSLSQTAPKATKDILTDDGNTCLLVESGGRVLWAGILWIVKPDGQVLNLVAARFWDYWNHRYIRATQSYDNVDLFEIVRRLIRYGQSPSRGSIGLAVDDHFHGVKTTHLFVPRDQKSIADAIGEFASRDDGFDFDVETVLDPGGFFSHNLKLRRPRIGQEVGVVLEYGRNMISYDPTYNAANRAGIVDVFGSFDDILPATVDASAFMTGPLLEHQVSESDIIDPAALLAKARRIQRAKSKSLTALQCVVAITDDPNVGDVSLGDTVRVRIDDGWMQVDAPFRTIAWGVNDSDSGATMQFSLVDEDQFE